MPGEALPAAVKRMTPVEALRRSRMVWADITLSVDFEAETLPLLFASDADFDRYHDAMEQRHHRKGRFIRQMRHSCETARERRLDGDWVGCLEALANGCEVRRSVFAQDDYQCVAARLHLCWAAIHGATMRLAERTEASLTAAHHLFTVASHHLKHSFAEASYFGVPKGASSTAGSSGREKKASAAAGSPLARFRWLRLRATVVLHTNWANFWAARSRWGPCHQHSVHAVNAALRLFPFYDAPEMGGPREVRKSELQQPSQDPLDLRSVPAGGGLPTSGGSGHEDGSFEQSHDPTDHGGESQEQEEAQGEEQEVEEDFTFVVQPPPIHVLGLAPQPSYANRHPLVALLDARRQLGAAHAAAAGDAVIKRRDGALLLAEVGTQLEWLLGSAVRRWTDGPSEASVDPAQSASASDGRPVDEDADVLAAPARAEPVLHLSMAPFEGDPVTQLPAGHAATEEGSDAGGRAPASEAPVTPVPPSSWELLTAEVSPLHVTFFTGALEFRTAFQSLQATAAFITTIVGAYTTVYLRHTARSRRYVGLAAALLHSAHDARTEADDGRDVGQDDDQQHPEAHAEEGAPTQVEPRHDWYRQLRQMQLSVERVHADSRVHELSMPPEYTREPSALLAVKLVREDVKARKSRAERREKERRWMRWAMQVDDTGAIEDQLTEAERRRLFQLDHTEQEQRALEVIAANAASTNLGAGGSAVGAEFNATYTGGAPSVVLPPATRAATPAAPDTFVATRPATRTSHRRAETPGSRASNRGLAPPQRQAPPIVAVGTVAKALVANRIHTQDLRRQQRQWQEEQEQQHARGETSADAPAPAPSGGIGTAPANGVGGINASGESLATDRSPSLLFGSSASRNLSAPELRSASERQRSLRAMLPSLDRHSEAYRRVNRQLAQNEATLREARDAAAYRKLLAAAERVAAQGGMLGAWRSTRHYKAHRELLHQQQHQQQNHEDEDRSSP